MQNAIIQKLNSFTGLDSGKIEFIARFEINKLVAKAAMIEYVFVFVFVLSHYINPLIKTCHFEIVFIKRFIIRTG